MKKISEFPAYDSRGFYIWYADRENVKVNAVVLCVTNRLLIYLCYMMNSAYFATTEFSTKNKQHKSWKMYLL